MLLPAPRLLRSATAVVSLLFAVFLASATLGQTAPQAPSAPIQTPSQPAQNSTHPGPQVVQYGAFHAPQQVLNAQNQWTALLPVASNNEEDTFIEDVSSPLWLQANADNFLSKGQYTVTVLTFYKSQRRCRADQIGNGFSDSAHVDACNDIRYRVRQIAVDAAQSVVTLSFSAMVWSDGTLDPDSVRQETRSRGFSELDSEARAAIAKATAIVAKQAVIYNNRQQNQP